MRSNWVIIHLRYGAVLLNVSVSRLFSQLSSIPIQPALPANTIIMTAFAFIYKAYNALIGEMMTR